MKAYHICYHTDEDGLASAAVIYEYLKRISKKFNEKVRYFFYKIDYTMDLKTVLPDIPAGDELYFVDYSFSNKDNLDYVLDLSTKGIEVIWIDHHKSSCEILSDIDLDKYINLHHFIDTNYCGAYLCYAYAYFKLNSYSADKITNYSNYPKYIPLYIRYVDSWDTWKHDMPDTTEFNIGVRSEKRTPKSVFSTMFKCDVKVINKLFSDNKEDIKLIESYMNVYIKNAISKGKIIKSYQDIENESFCNSYGFEFDIIDKTNSDEKIYHCFAVNKRGNSTMFGDKFSTYDIVVPYQFNGTQYVYSLYTSKEDVNCEELAKKFGCIDGLGGGGHVKAAGFQTLNQIIKANCKVYISNKLFSKDKYKLRISDK